MKNSKNKDFTYILFDSIAYNDKLTLSDKLVAMYVYTYYRNGRVVSASNRHIARTLNMPESTCFAATNRLVHNGLISISKKGRKRTINVLQPELIDCKFKQFDSSIIHSNLEIGAKFLFVYILSFLRDGKRGYDSNANIKTNIGLGKDWVASAAQELVRAGLIWIKNPGQPFREYCLTSGFNTKTILIKLKSDGFPQAVSKDSDGRIDYSGGRIVTSSNRNEDSGERLEVSVDRANYISNNTTNEIKKDISHQVTELPKVITEDSFVEDDDLPFPDVAPSLKSDSNLDDFDIAFSETMKSRFPDSYEETENTSSNGTKVTFDDLVKTISTASPDTYEDVFQHLQQNNINVCQTMPTGLLNALRGVEDFSDVLSDKKILVHFMMTEEGSNYYIMNLDLVLPIPAMGFDTRLFKFRPMGDEKPAVLDDQFGMLLVAVKNGSVDIDELTDEERSELGQTGQLVCSKRFKDALNQYNGTPNVPSVSRVRYKDMLINRMNEELALTPPSRVG